MVGFSPGCSWCFARRSTRPAERGKPERGKQGVFLVGSNGQHERMSVSVVARPRFEPTKSEHAPPGGFSQVRRAAETPLNMVLEARH
jgi:hypothetical protein